MPRALVLTLCLMWSIAVAWASPPIPAFPGVPTTPLPAGLSFGGYFRAHQPVRVVFGVSDPGRQAKETLTNAALMIQYLKAHGERYQMQVVLYGKGIFIVDTWKTEDSVYQDLITALHAQGVQFRVCYNSMTALHVSTGDLYPLARVVPAGILQIVKKEMQGYSYVTNR